MKPRASHPPATNLLHGVNRAIVRSPKTSDGRSLLEQWRPREVPNRAISKSRQQLTFSLLREIVEQRGEMAQKSRLAFSEESLAKTHNCLHFTHVLPLFFSAAFNDDDSPSACEITHRDTKRSKLNSYKFASNCFFTCTRVHLELFSLKM